MAYQSDRAIPLANGMKLRHGQIIGSAETVATAASRDKKALSGVAVHDGQQHPHNLGGADWVTPRRPKSPTTPAPVIGQGRDRSKPIG